MFYVPERSSEFADNAHDLKALRDAVVDAGAVGGGLWISYLFVLFYLAVAVGGVTHQVLFLESPVKLPFLGVDLPLVFFFAIGPLLFIIVHTYVLLHIVLLAGKVGAYQDELNNQVDDGDTQARLRRQLPSNILVQYLAGPPETSGGCVGLMLRAIAWISLIGGPVALLILFELRFLPYHNEFVNLVASHCRPV